MFPKFGLSMEKFAQEEPQLNSRILFNSVAMVTGRIKATRKLVIESAYWVKELHRKVHEDPSTGLWKQTFINEEINQLLENPMALIMIKPDRFKILVDAQGHEAGDEAMILIAAILKNITRKLNRGWALRFKSNETGILINKCDSAEAESLALSISNSIASLPPVPLRGRNETFPFSSSISWGIWPQDDKSWDSLLDGIYALLLDTSKAGGNKIVRYSPKRSA
jgi:diguanylate cyclase (GGDEF)-like protein